MKNRIILITSCLAALPALALPGLHGSGVRISGLTAVTATGPEAQPLLDALIAQGIAPKSQLESSGREVAGLRCYIRPLAWPGQSCELERNGKQVSATYDFTRAVLGFLLQHHVPSQSLDRAEQMWSFDSFGCYLTSEGGSARELSCNFTDSRLARRQPGEALIASRDATDVVKLLGGVDYDGSDANNGRSLSLRCRTTTCQLVAYPLELAIGENGESLEATITGEAAGRLYSLIPTPATTETYRSRKRFRSYLGTVDILCEREPYSTHCKLTLEGAKEE